MAVVAPLQNESLLLRQLAGGDPAGFAGIYDHYSAAIHAFVLQYVHSPQMADDLSQEIFLKIWENRATMSGVGSFRAYLFTAARNHTLNTLRSAFRREATLNEVISHVRTGDTTYTGSSEPASDRLLTHEYAAFLKKAVDDLPPRCREVFRLCREQSMSYEEVAAELGIARNSVRNHMVLSLKLLRKAVSRELGIPLALLLVIVYGIK
jgi:RNA polymerase sigma-70 factor (family 1)